MGERRLTGFEQKIADYNTYFVDAMLAAEVNDLSVLEPLPTTRARVNSEKNKEVYPAFVKPTNKEVRDNERQLNFYTYYNEACTNSYLDANTSYNLEGLKAKADQILSLLENETLILKTATGNNAIAASTKIYVYLQNLQSVLAEANALNINHGDKEVQTLFNKMNKCLKDLKPIQNREMKKLSKSKTKDASAVSHVLDMTKILTEITNAYTIKRTGPYSALTRFRYAGRRDAQMDMLKKALANNNPQQQMAMLLAVYQSIQSETLRGEKFQFLGKSSLQTIIEDTLKKHGVKDLNQYETVSEVNNLKIEIPKNAADHSEDIKLQYHLDKITKNDGAINDYLLAKRTDITNRLQAYIESKNSKSGLGDNEGDNVEMAKTIKKVVESLHNTNNNTIASLKRIMPNLIKIDALGHILAPKPEGTGELASKSTIIGGDDADEDKPKAMQRITSNELKSIVRDLVELNKMEQSKTSLGLNSKPTSRPKQA